MRTTSTHLLLAAALLAPVAASAQGTLSVLGFGYPSGQQSTRSLGTGGALGEMDPLSSSNPAAILSAGGSALYFQAEPEYRTLSNPATSQRTSVARYPLVVATIPVRSNLMLGLSFSNFLDRTFQTTSRGFQQIGDSTLATANTFKSDGAIGESAPRWRGRPRGGCTRRGGACDCGRQPRQEHPGLRRQHAVRRDRRYVDARLRRATRFRRASK